MATLHIEDSNAGNRGNTFVEGEYDELVIAIVGIMQASPEIRMLLKNAVTAYSLAEMKGLNIVNNIDIKIDEDAKKAFNNLTDKKKS